jgi:hypothetical protein
MSCHRPGSGSSTKSAACTECSRLDRVPEKVAGRGRRSCVASARAAVRVAVVAARRETRKQRKIAIHLEAECDQRSEVPLSH